MAGRLMESSFVFSRMRIAAMSTTCPAGLLALNAVPSVVLTMVHFLKVGFELCPYESRFALSFF